MKVLCLSRYDSLGASSRLRFFQYFDYLHQQGVEIDVEPLLGNAYLADLYAGRVSWSRVLGAYFQRVARLLQSGFYDLIWLEKEAFPRLPAWFEFSVLPSGIPLVVDYDDAVFHQYDLHSSSLFRVLMGRKIDHVMQRADLVIGGSRYLVDRAHAVGARRVELIPTVVDTGRYQESPSRKAADQVTVGWIGTPSTAPFLRLILPAVRKAVEQGGVRFVAVGANVSQVEGTPIEAVPWTEASEVGLIQSFDIGIMPLADAPFERGKCGYKLIQYMACGKPVIASPVGANKDIVRHGVDGFLAETLPQWQDFLEQLVTDQALCCQMGASGRARVVSDFSLDVAAPRLHDLLKSVVGHS